MTDLYKSNLSLSKQNFELNHITELIRSISKNVKLSPKEINNKEHIKRLYLSTTTRKYPSTLSYKAYRLL